MKRSKAINKIAHTIVVYFKKDMDLEKSPLNIKQLDDLSDNILYTLEDLGMKPPLSTCKMVEDTYNGGTKHGPVKHEWDEE